LNLKLEVSMKTLKKLTIIIIILLGVALFCKKNEDKNQDGLELFLLLQSQNQSGSGSGFMIRIPDGIAK
jgi:hypothetical protein